MNSAEPTQRRSHCRCWCCRSPEHESNPRALRRYWVHINRRLAWAALYASIPWSLRNWHTTSLLDENFAMAATTPGMFLSLACSGSSSNTEVISSAALKLAATRTRRATLLDSFTASDRTTSSCLACNALSKSVESTPQSRAAATCTSERRVPGGERELGLPATVLQVEMYVCSVGVLCHWLQWSRHVHQRELSK